SFTFQVQDDGGTLNSGQDTDQSPNRLSFNVTAVNDAPSGANRTLTARQDAPYVFATSDFGFSDTTDSPSNSLGAVIITTLPTAGTITPSGQAVAATQRIPVAAITGGQLQFVPT